MSLSVPELIYCAVVLLLAYSLRGSTGFGGAVGMPLLALVIPFKVLVQTQERARSPVIAPVASMLSGVVGAMFGTMATIFFVMYLDTRNLAKSAFRATMSAMLLLLSIVRGAGYYAVGEFTRESLVLFAAAFPAMLIGIYTGNRIHLNISEVAFRRLVIIVLFACAVPLVLR